MAVAFVAATVLVSCSGARTEQPPQLGSVQAVVSFGPTTSSVVPESEGLALLINDESTQDNPVQVIRTHGIAMPRAVFGKNGLVVPSNKEVHVLDSSLTTLGFDPGPDGVDVTHTAWTAVGRADVVHLFNVGHTPTGYRMRAVVTGKRFATSSDVEGLPNVIGRCGGTTYMVAPASGKYSPTNTFPDPSAPTHRVAITELAVTTENGKPVIEQKEILVGNEEPNRAQQTMDAPCVDGALAAFGFTPDGSTELLLRRVADGSLQRFPVRLLTGEPIRDTEAAGGVMSSQTFVDNKLYWISWTGVLYETEFDGTTRPIREGLPPTSGASLYDIADKQWHCLDLTDHTAAVWRTYNLTTGDEVRSQPVPTVHQLQTDSSMFPSTFTVRSHQ